MTTKLHVLTVTTETQGARAGDFTGANDGELVRLSSVCTRGELDPDEQNCGCGRAFTGLTTLKATTTAVIVATTMSLRDYTAAVAESLGRSGGPAAQEHAGEIARELLLIAKLGEPGTVVERRGDTVSVRD